MGGDSAGGIEVFADVAVAVVGRVIDADGALVEAGGEQAADAARALGGAAEVGAPKEGGAQGQGGAGIFRDEIPAVVKENGGGAGGDLGDAPAQGVVLVVGGAAADGGGGNQAILRVPNHGRVLHGAAGGRERVGRGITVVVIDGGGGRAGDGGILVDRIGRVIVGAWEGRADGGFFAIADGVVFENPVRGVVAVVGEYDLAQSIVVPMGGAGGGTAPGGVGSLAEGIDRIVDAGADRAANGQSIDFRRQHIAVGLPVAGRDMHWAGDGRDQVTAGLVSVGKGLSAVSDRERAAG